MNRRNLRERLLSRLVIDPSGCVLWTGRIGRDGYAYIKVNGRYRAAHRVMWEMFAGPIPDGLQLDHLCRVRRCANVAHLEPVSPRENNRRGIGPAAVNAAKTHCDNGHEFTMANTYRYLGSGSRAHRYCRTCDRQRKKATRQQHAARWDAWYAAHPEASTP